MVNQTFTELAVENAALAWLRETGWQIAHGPDIAPDTLAAERRDFGEAILERRLRDALARLNPALPAEAVIAASVGQLDPLIQRSSGNGRLMLGALRDILLPKLISGKYRVRGVGESLQLDFSKG